MHQIVFNEISAAEFSAIPTLEQLELVNSFQVDGESVKTGEKEGVFGVVERDGRKIFRYRFRDYRVYFTLEEDKIVVQRVLHTNSLRDFLFRTGMSTGTEDQRLSESRSFWHLIDEGEKAARK